MNLPISKKYVLHFYYKDEGFYYADCDLNALEAPPLKEAIQIATKQGIVKEDDCFILIPLGKNLVKMLK
jgi:hypothetical protein